MANITEILGTDSLSSSRPVINSNFQLLNDDIADIQALVDPVNSTIQNVNSATFQSLTILANNTIASFTSNGITMEQDVEMTAKTTIAGQLVKSGIDGSDTNPSGASGVTSANLTESTYLIDTDFTLPEGNSDGQEVTFINVGSSSVEVVSTYLSVNSLFLDNKNSTVTLRYIGSNWYVISSYAATIS